MLPVLFSIGSFPISSFGVFLALAFLAAVFAVWRLARVYDVNEEKILDLAILVFFGSIVGARIFFMIFHWQLFDSLEKFFLLNRYPGLSFWGGMIGGGTALWFFGRKSKSSLWQLLDFAAIGLLIGLVFGNIGCLLGGCSYGVVSSSFWAVPVTGLLGKRFPVTILEGVVSLPLFSGLWKQAVRFHFEGKIVALSFIWLGIVKFFTEFYRGDSQRLIPSLWFTFGHLFALSLFVAGVVIFYRRAHRSFPADVREFLKIFHSQKKRQALILQLRKGWYNHLVNFRVKFEGALRTLHSLPKILKRKLNVKSTPTNFR